MRMATIPPVVRHVITCVSVVLLFFTVYGKRVANIDSLCVYACVCVCMRVTCVCFIARVSKIERGA